MAEQAIPQPPKTPEMDRKLRFHRTQLIGMPLIMLIPILALFGLFDPTPLTQQAQQGAIELHVEYATRTHYKVGEPLVVRVKNISATTIPTLTVAFEAKYINSFEQVAFKPEVESVNDAVYVVQLNDVEPGSLRMVHVELETAHTGYHAGTISAAAGDQAPITLQVRHLILP